MADLAEIQRLAARVMGSALWQHTNDDAIAAVRESAVAARMVQAAHLTAIADMDSRAGTLPGGPAGYETRTFLRHDLRRTMTQAKADIAAAHALQPDADPAQRGLPRLGTAFAAGEVSREHVDAAVRVMNRLPKSLLPAPLIKDDGSPLLDEHGQPMCAGDAIDEKLTAHAKEYDSHHLSELAKELADTMDPDGRFDPSLCSKRSLRLHWDFAGMLVLRGELDPASGALLMAMIDQVAAPKRHPAGEKPDEDDDSALINISDRRGTDQRQADALMDIVRAAAGSGKAGHLGNRGGEPPRSTLLTRPEDVAAAHAAHDAAQNDTSEAARGDDAAFRRGTSDAGAGYRTGYDGDGAYLGTGGTRVSARLLALLSCDSILQTALLAPGGAVLDLRREVRTITPAQRRALTARDRGCVIPGCSVPAVRCHGHHIRWGSRGGDTDIANLALVCPRHHTEIHAETWRLTVKDDVPWVIPPDWVDPDQRPMRNKYFQHRQEMRDLGTQLRLGLFGDGPGGDVLRPDGHVPRPGSDP